MQRLDSRRGRHRMSTFLGKAAAALIFTAALCQSGVANAGPHGGGGGGFHGGGFGGFHAGGFHGGGFHGGGFHAGGFHSGGFHGDGSMTVDLEGFAVDLACWDGPTTRIHTDRIIIRTTVTAGANTATHIPGITAPIPPVITRM
jgi:hypothetical protein